MLEDFRWEEVDWVRGMVRIGADRSHPVISCQGSGGVMDPSMRKFFPRVSNYNSCQGGEMNVTLEHDGA